MAKPLVLPLAQQQPGPSLNIRFQIIFAVPNVAVNVPGFRCAPGTSIELRTTNGITLNTAPVFIAETPEGLGLGTGARGGIALPPGADVTLPWPVDNTAEIWCMGGAEGDGLLISIQQASIG